MEYRYNYPRPAVTVDAVVFKINGGKIQVLLIRRLHDPYKDCWALPGGFIEIDETLEQSVIRELFEETGLTDVSLCQLYTFGNPDRDPRGRTISIAFVGICGIDSIVQAADDAADVQWYSIDEIPQLAFDHDRIVAKAVAWLKAKEAS